MIILKCAGWADSVASIRAYGLTITMHNPGAQIYRGWDAAGLLTMIRLGAWKGFHGVWAEGGVSAGVAIGGGRTWLKSGEYIAIGGVRLDDNWGDWYWLELEGRYGRRVHATAYAVGDDGW